MRKREEGQDCKAKWTAGQCCKSTQVMGRIILQGEREVAVGLYCKRVLTGGWEVVLQYFFLIVPFYFSFILVVYLLGEVDIFTPILCIFSFAPHLPCVSLTFLWT